MGGVMDILIILLVGFVMNFLVGYGLKGFFFGDMLPKARAFYTAILSYFVCLGAAAFGGYLVMGNVAALLVFSWIALLYAVPAFFHYLLLFYQFNMDWTDTDEEEAEALALEEAKASRRIASIKVQEDPE